MFEISTGMGRDWDGVKAIADAITTLQKKLHQKPKFLLFFTTIHYKKGHRKMLDLISNSFGPDVPMVGGTIPGFIVKEGVFSRGVLIAAYVSDEVEVFQVVGTHTKRNPKRAATQLVEQIKKDSRVEKYKTKILIEFISGPTVPQFPMFKRKKVIRNNQIGKLLSLFSNLFLETFENGVGREEEVLQTLASNLADWQIIGGSTLDDNNLIDNMQFYGNQILRNSIVGLVILTNKSTSIKTTYGLKQSGKPLSIQLNDRNSRIITQVDSMPAVHGLLQKTGWFEDTLDEKLYRKTFHYTIGFKKNGILYPEVIGACYGSDIWVGYNMDGTDVQILIATGDKILEAIKSNIDEQIGPKTDFFFMTCCASIMETLGRNNYLIKKILDDKFNEKDYFLLYVGGEDTYGPFHGCRHVNYSFNSIV